MQHKGEILFPKARLDAFLSLCIDVERDVMKR